MLEGIESCRSRYSVDETVSRLESMLRARQVTLFCVVDHSGEAAKAGLAMRPTKLLIFGSPAAGTPVMVASPSAALDLPLKILVAEDEDGGVSLLWNDPGWLAQRHGFAPALAGALGAAGGLAGSLAP